MQTLGNSGVPNSTDDSSHPSGCGCYLYSNMQVTGCGGHVSEILLLPCKHNTLLSLSTDDAVVLT